MRERLRRAVPQAAWLCVALCCALAGCTASTAAGAPAAAGPAKALPLTMSLATQKATWAVVRTGGRSAGGTFWQLLVRQQDSSSWRLVTPPGVADNGGLVSATAGNSGLVVGFLPNQQLKFTPLAITADDGAHWSQGLLPASLVASPGALAVLPDGRLLAATTKGVEESAHGAAGWSVLVSLRALAATKAGRACGLTRLTAVAWSQAGGVLAAGQCTHAGTAVVFSQANGGWQAASWKLTGSFAHLQAAVLRLTGAATGPNVIVLAGAGTAQTVFAANLNRSGSKLSEWYRTSLNRSARTSFFLAQSGGWGAVIGGRAQYEIPFGPPTGASSGSVNAAPAQLPGPGATVTFGSASTLAAQTHLFALVPGVDTVAVWQEGESEHWARTQVISIPAGPG